MLVCQTGGSGSTNSVQNNFASSDVGPGQYNQSAPNYQVRNIAIFLFLLILFTLQTSTNTNFMTTNAQQQYVNNPPA